MTSKLITSMIEYFHEEKYIGHALKVYGYAYGIGEESVLSADNMRILEAAAVLHDIGIPQAIRLHGSAAGPYQEKEGAIIARPLLLDADYSDAETERITGLIARHHTTEAAQDDPLLRILMEADALVNLGEGNRPMSSAREIFEGLFRTPAAIRYMRAMYADAL